MILMSSVQKIVQKLSSNIPGPINVGCKIFFVDKLPDTVTSLPLNKFKSTMNNIIINT